MISDVGASEFDTEHRIGMQNAFVAVGLEAGVPYECEVLDIHQQVGRHAARAAVDRELTDHEPCSRDHDVEGAGESIGCDRCPSYGNRHQSGKDPLENDTCGQFVVRGDTGEVAEIFIVPIFVARLIETTAFQDDIEMIHRPTGQVPLIC